MNVDHPRGLGLIPDIVQCFPYPLQRFIRQAISVILHDNSDLAARLLETDGDQAVLDLFSRLCLNAFSMIG